MKLGTVFLAALLLANTAIAADPGVTDTEVVIGTTSIESGPFALFSTVTRAGAAYFDMVNAKGGVNGRKIKFVRIDTQGDHLKTVQGTKKLVEDEKVFAVYNGIGSTHQAVYKYLMEKGVPDVLFSDTLQEYSVPVKKTVFPSSFSWSAESSTMVDWLAQKHQGKKVCFLIADNTSGQEFFTGAKEALDKANTTLTGNNKLTLGAVEKVDRSAAQANTQILKLKQDKCDVVMLNPSGALPANAMTYAASQKFTPLWMVTTWNAGPKFLELIPESIRNGIISSTAISVDSNFNVPGWAEFEKTMVANKIPISRAQNGWAQAEMFVEALKRAGKDLTREGLVKALESMDGYTCSLCLIPMTMSPKNHSGFSKPVMIITKDGKWTRL